MQEKLEKVVVKSLAIAMIAHFDKDEWVHAKCKEIEIIHRLFLVIAMHCQASSSQFNQSLNLPRC